MNLEGGKNKSLSLNIFLNLVRKSANIVFPFVFTFYGTSVLPVEEYGSVSVSKSIVSYFALLAALGVVNYSIRTGAKIRDNRDELEHFASVMFTLNIISTVLAYAFMFAFVAFSKSLRPYFVLMLINSITIVLTAIGMDWVNVVYEDYVYITIRTIVVYLISIALLILTVKKPGDGVRFIAVQSLASCGGYIANFFYIRKYVKVRFILSKEIIDHLKPIFLIFFNTIATTIYISSDITMVGLIRNDYEAGIYDVASKVYTSVKMALNSIIFVALPRISIFFASHENERASVLVRQIIDFITPVVFAISGILFIYAESIMKIIGDELYVEGGGAVRILGVAAIFTVQACIYFNGVLLALAKDRLMMCLTIIAAIMNVTLNFLFIPSFGYTAAAGSTMICELFMCVMGYIYTRNILKMDVRVKQYMECAVVLISVIIESYIINILFGDSIVSFLIASITGGILLLIEEVLFKNETILYYIKVIKSKLR